VIIELASSDELYIDVSSEVTKAIEKVKEREAWGLINQNTAISIPNRVVWETIHGPKYGPFNYFIPKANVSLNH